MRGVGAFLWRCAVLAGCLAAVSCADSGPRVASAQGMVVLDYAAQDALPSARLAVFVQTESEVRRVSSVRVDSRESGYRWHIGSPRMLQGGERQWACYTNLLPPENGRIPQGAYDVRCIDAAGEEAEAGFSVAYEESLLGMRADGVRAALSGAADESLALYDGDGVLVFFGRRRDGWRTDADILRDYGTAVSVRRCIVGAGERVVCLLPAESLRAEAAE